MITGDKFVREIAKNRDGFDVRCDAWGHLQISGDFEYETGGGQGFSWNIDDVFIVKFLKAFGVFTFRETANVLVYVTHNDFQIVKIEPIFSKDGSPFDILEWSNGRDVESW